MDRAQSDSNKVCCLCKQKGFGQQGQGGFLRARNVGGKKVHVHEYCARFCPKVYEGENGNLESVGNEIRRGNGLVRNVFFFFSLLSFRGDFVVRARSIGFRFLDLARHCCCGCTPVVNARPCGHRTRL